MSIPEKLVREYRDKAASAPSSAPTTPVPKAPRCGNTWRKANLLLLQDFRNVHLLPKSKVILGQSVDFVNIMYAMIGICFGGVLNCFAVRGRQVKPEDSSLLYLPTIV